MPRPENIPGGLRDEARAAGERLFESYPGYQLSPEDIPRLPGLGANYSYTVTVDTGVKDNDGKTIYKSAIITSRSILRLSDIRDAGIAAVIANAKKGTSDEIYALRDLLVPSEMSLVEVDAIYRK